MPAPKVQPLTETERATCTSLTVAYTRLVADGDTAAALDVYIELHELEDGY